ncbi:hypothetical protein H1S01_16655 [Heliobacterium chlorum]|uniref:Uncharacterized protein n=1 Tax=Heliobacterium chlorum TaxID=2698 RepID=A0ABR7T7B4_HELCL|nr:hypothetical protein [Heliobacterium chlorum]MBC9786102.1 hypothetical protein [Heliobacterium chlorum]
MSLIIVLFAASIISYFLIDDILDMLIAWRKPKKRRKQSTRKLPTRVQVAALSVVTPIPTAKRASRPGRDPPRRKKQNQMNSPPRM